jgi:hypothetical protein
MEMIIYVILLAAKQKTHSTEWVGLAKSYLKSDQTNATMEWGTKIEKS